MNQLCTWQAFKKELRERASRSPLILAPSDHGCDDSLAPKDLISASPLISAKGIPLRVGVSYCHFGSTTSLPFSDRTLRLVPAGAPPAF